MKIVPWSNNKKKDKMNKNGKDCFSFGEKNQKHYIHTFILITLRYKWHKSVY